MFENTTDDCSSKSWIDFNETSLKFTYNVTDIADAVTHMTLEASDPYNLPQTMAISISVNFKPNVNTSIVTLSGTFVAQEFSYFEIDGRLFSDENTSSLQFTIEYANGSAADSWLTFVPPSSPPSGLFNFSGTYPNFEKKEFTMAIVAEDEEGLTERANFTLIIDVICHSTCKDCFGPYIGNCTS